MTTQPKPQPARTINLVDLSQDIHTGTLTMVAICHPSAIEELLLMHDRSAIHLNTPGGFAMPKSTDRGNLLVLFLERSRATIDEYEIGEAIGILPQAQWPDSGQQFDDFVGSLRSLIGQQITWHPTISGTAADPRLGHIIVQYRSPMHGSSRIAIERETEISRKVSMPRPIA